MSDPEPSGAATPAAETASTPGTPPSPTPLPSAFSNSRGSGLARGKRPVSPAAPAASAAPAVDYKPTAVSIVTAPTEYKNPFAPPAPAAAPTEPAPAEAVTPPPSPVPAPAAPVDEAPAAAAIPAVEVRHEPRPAAPAETEPMPELNILPPEAPKRVEHNWESDSFRSVASQPSGEPSRSADDPPSGQRPRRDDRRDERPTFRPERDRRDDRPAEPRPAWNEPGRGPGREPEQNEFPVAPKTEAPRKSGGFFGWLKKLFGGSTAEAPKPEADTRGEREYGREGQFHRRRRRGGRGRNFHGDQRGPRDGQPGGQPSGDSRGYGGEHRNQGGRHRRRHHGGGDFRGGGRPGGGPPQGS